MRRRRVVVGGDRRVVGAEVNRFTRNANTVDLLSIQLDDRTVVDEDAALQIGEESRI